MNAKPNETKMSAMPAKRKPRPAEAPQPMPHPGIDAMPESMAETTPSPAAIDEVFATMARNLDRLQQTSDEVRKMATDVRDEQMSHDENENAEPMDMDAKSMEKANTSGKPMPEMMSQTDPKEFHDITEEMDRQHSRLMQLLRDIIA